MTWSRASWYVYSTIGWNWAPGAAGACTHRQHLYLGWASMDTLASEAAVVAFDDLVGTANWFWDVSDDFNSFCVDAGSLLN